MPGCSSGGSCCTSVAVAACKAVTGLKPALAQLSHLNSLSAVATAPCTAGCQALSMQGMPNCRLIPSNVQPTQAVTSVAAV